MTQASVLADKRSRFLSQTARRMFPFRRVVANSHNCDRARKRPWGVPPLPLQNTSALPSCHPSPNSHKQNKVLKEKPLRALVGQYWVWSGEDCVRKQLRTSERRTSDSGAVPITPGKTGKSFSTHRPIHPPQYKSTEQMPISSQPLPRARNIFCKTTGTLTK